MATKEMLMDVARAGLPGGITKIVDMIWAALEPDRLVRAEKDKRIDKLEHDIAFQASQALARNGSFQMVTQNDVLKVINDAIPGSLTHRRDMANEIMNLFGQELADKEIKIDRLNSLNEAKKEIIKTNTKAILILTEESDRLKKLLAEEKKVCEDWRKFALGMEERPKEVWHFIHCDKCGMWHRVPQGQTKLGDCNAEERRPALTPEEVSKICGPWPQKHTPEEYKPNYEAHPGEECDAEFTVDEVCATCGTKGHTHETCPHVHVPNLPVYERWMDPAFFIPPLSFGALDFQNYYYLLNTAPEDNLTRKV